MIVILRQRPSDKRNSAMPNLVIDHGDDGAGYDSEMMRKFPLSYMITHFYVTNEAENEIW